MKFETHLPCERLRPHVKHIIIIENVEAQHYKILPGTSLVMGFQYSGRLAYQGAGQPIKLDTAGITGLMDSYRIFQNEVETGTVLVVFQEAGAARFFANPVNELFRQSLSLEDLFSPVVLNETKERLAEAANDKDKIAVVEALLLAQLRDGPTDLMVYKALQYIHQSKGTIRITDLADKLNTSQSPLEKRFRKIVGASPKKFANIVRIKNVIKALDDGDQDNAAFLAGYYDQAHFIKDFKTFTADTPEQYLKALHRGSKTK